MKSQKVLTFVLKLKLIKISCVTRLIIQQIYILNGSILTIFVREMGLMISCEKSISLLCPVVEIFYSLFIWIRRLSDQKIFLMNLWWKIYPTLIMCTLQVDFLIVFRVIFGRYLWLRRAYQLSLSTTNIFFLFFQ